MGKSSIEWTDETWNPVRGCTKVSPGCKHCYAAVFAERFRGVSGHPYEQGFDLRLVPEKLMEPLRWRRQRNVFVNSMSDLFHEDVPDEYVDRVFATMLACHAFEGMPSHNFQVLTKRSRRMADYFSVDGDAMLSRWARAGDGRIIVDNPDIYFSEYVDGLRGNSPGHALTWPLPNVWLGVSVEDRQYGLPRIDQLREIPARVRFLSIEPLLEDLGVIDLRGIDWVICGGESGPKARQFDPAWARSLRDQCREAGVPFMMKQTGARVIRPYYATPDDFVDDSWLEHALNCKHEIVVDGAVWDPEYGQPPLNAQIVYRPRDKKGGDMSEWPEDLRVRQFPEVRRG